MIEVKKLIDDYETTCNAIIDKFAKVYDVRCSKDDWVGGDVGGTICINDEFFINMDDIILMLKKGVKWTTFLECWDYGLFAHEYGFASVNLRSWVKGYHGISKEGQAKIRNLRGELDGLVRRYKDEGEDDA